MWADVLRASLSFFLVIVGIGIAYVCLRLGGVLRRMTISVGEVTDEVVPILSRAQTTVDGINLELSRVDEIMVSAVNATKGAEKTVTTISHAVTAPVRTTSGWAAAAKEAVATFKARRAESRTETDEAAAAATSAPGPAAPEAAPAVAVAHGNNGSVSAEDLPPELRDRDRGPSLSQIAWAMPRRRV